MSTQFSASEALTRIVDGAIDEAEIRAAVESEAHGATVLFHGVVRNHDEGRDVLSLDYRAHPDAERFLAECVRAELASGEVLIAAAHRVGELRIGDAALVVAVSSAHRSLAFEVIERLVTRIKKEVPIWKRQHYVDGVSEWVGL